jgi:hypothetical protein
VASQSIQSKKGGEDPDLLLSWGSPETPCEIFRILEISWDRTVMFPTLSDDFLSGPKLFQVFPTTSGTMLYQTRDPEVDYL